MVALFDFLDDRVEFLVFASIDHVREIRTNHVAMRRDHDNVELVDLLEFRRFGVRGSGHSRELLVHAEVILNRDRGQGLVFLADMHALLGFHRLVQSVGPAPAGHQSTGEFIDDDHLAVFHDVVHVALENRVGLQRLLHMVQGVDLSRIIEIMDTQQPFNLRNPAFRQSYRATFLVDCVITLFFDGRAVIL